MAKTEYFTNIYTVGPYPQVSETASNLSEYLQKCHKAPYDIVYTDKLLFEFLGKDLLTELLYHLEYEELEVIREFEFAIKIIKNPKFWIDKAEKKWQINQKDFFNKIGTCTENVYYELVMKLPNVFFKGSEKYKDIVKCMRYAIETNDNDLFEYYLNPDSDNLIDPEKLLHCVVFKQSYEGGILDKGLKYFLSFNSIGYEQLKGYYFGGHVERFVELLKDSQWFQLKSSIYHLLIEFAESYVKMNDGNNQITDYLIKRLNNLNKVNECLKNNAYQKIFPNLLKFKNQLAKEK